jgi:hypothetical protein
MSDDTLSEADRGLAELRAAAAKRGREVQTHRVPGHPDLTMRELANAFVAMTFRNGMLEDLHAGKDSPLLTDPSLSRITDREMKKLMIETSAQLAIALCKFFEQPEEFQKWLRLASSYTRHWEREALTDE